MLELNNVISSDDGQAETVSCGLLPQLDLTMIKFKLLRNEEGTSWISEQAEHAEKLYRMFLVLHVRYPDRTIVPTKMIDAFWHQHILDTRKYAQDCQVIFGFFLHHFPYFGLRGEEDAGNLTKAFAETEELFLSEFGETLNVKINHAHCSNCFSGCTNDTPPELGSDPGKPASQLATHLTAKPSACGSGCSSCSSACQ